MKKILLPLLSVFVLAFSAQSYVFAAAQSVGGAELYGDDGTPGDAAAGGVTYTGDFTLTTTADGDDIGTTAGVSITPGADNQGTLQADHTIAINGTVGTGAGDDLKVLNAGAAGKTVTISGASFIQTTNLTSTGAIAVNANLTGALDYDNGATGTVTLGTGVTLTGAVTNTTTNEGTLVLSSGSSVTGAVGNTGVGLNTISVSGGNASIGGNTLASDFALAGNTLAITGTLGIDAAGGITTTATSGSSFGNITSTGAATIAAGASTAVTVSGFIANGSSLTIVDGTGGAGVGALGTISSTSPNVTFAQSGAGGADLVLVATRTTTSATTGDNVGIATTINALGTPTGDMSTVLGALDSLTTASQVDSAYSQLDPTVNGGAAQTSFANSSLHFDSVTGHLSDVRNGVNTGSQTGLSTGDAWYETAMWVKGMGNHSEQDNRGGISGYDADTWGVSGGLDGLVSEGVRVGIAGGYAASEVDNKNEAGGTDIDSYQGTVYVGFDNKPWYINTAFSFAWNNYDSTRNISFGTINRTANSDTDGQQYSVLLDGGYVIPADQWEITPLMSLEYSRLNINGYTETGAGALNLIVDDQDYDFLQMGLGGKFAYPIMNDSGTWTPEVHVRWLYDFIGDKVQTTSKFSGGGGSFSTNGLDPAQSALNAGAGITFYSKGNITLSGVYDFTYKEDFTSHNGEAVLRYNF